REVERVRVDVRDAGVPLAALRQHALGDVAGDDLRACLREGDGAGAGAGCQVEDPFAGTRVDGVRDDAAPPARLAQGQEVVHEVVAGSDGVEHRGDVCGILVELRAVHALQCLPPGHTARIRPGTD